MKAKTLVCTVVQGYLNSILKAQMCSPLSHQISDFRFVLLLGKVIHSNEVLWGLPQCPRCFYVTCIWNIWHQRWPRCKDISLQDHWKHHFTGCLPLVFSPGLCDVCPVWVSGVFVCLHEEKFSLVVARFKRCLSCIYPLFIWRMSSAYSVWGGIVSWLLRSVLNATAVFFFSCFSCGMSPFLYTHICEKRCPNRFFKKKKKYSELTDTCCRGVLFCFLSSQFKKTNDVGFISSKLSLIQHICLLLRPDWDCTCRWKECNDEKLCRWIVIYYDL